MRMRSSPTEAGYYAVSRSIHRGWQSLNSPTVEKFAPTDKYQYGYFSVNVVDKGKGPQIAKDRAEESPVQKDVKHKSVEKFEEQFEPRNINIIVHELTSRVDKLEKMVTTLSGDVGHKPGDEDIPF